MKRNHWNMWGAAVVMAAALSMASVGEADAGFERGLPLPVDDPAEVNGVGANHQVSDEVSALGIARRASFGLLMRMIFSIPTEDWEWMKLPVYQTTPGD